MCPNSLPSLLHLFGDGSDKTGVCAIYIFTSDSSGRERESDERGGGYGWGEEGGEHFSENS